MEGNQERTWRPVRQAAYFFATVVLLAQSGCGSLPSTPVGPAGYRVVARSDSGSPAWINDIGRWNKDHGKKTGDRWFSASSPLENSLQGAKHDSFSRAQRKASEKIGDQSWNLLENSVKRRLHAGTQEVDRIKDDTTTGLRQMSQSWLVGGEEYAYHWEEYQALHPENVPANRRTLYRSWALVKYSAPNWECSRINSLKMLPIVASNLGGPALEYKTFNPEKYKEVVQNVVDNTLALIPVSVCSGG